MACYSIFNGNYVHEEIRKVICSKINLYGLILEAPVSPDEMAIKDSSLLFQIFLLVKFWEKFGCKIVRFKNWQTKQIKRICASFLRKFLVYVITSMTKDIVKLRKF